ncbi:alpha/beta hydrolase [Rhodococcus sp. NPDC056743]|uniref:alpha/beta hydrolase n=1 Tax=Rhodococcus sp. NPDC056743 TaxID=3345934 RepID=UPI00367336A7
MLETTSATQRFEFPVAVGSSVDAIFAGYFHPATTPIRRAVLQVVVHGVSYDHRYWDAGVVNDRDYSYVRYMTAQGFDVLAVDLPGVGTSSKPNGYDFSLDGVAHALSSLVVSLKQSGNVTGHNFDRVTLVGHSMGSTIGVYAEANWPAADALIVTATGYYSDRETSGWAPGVREKLLEADYALVHPELRLMFYHPGAADPAAIAYDNHVLRSATPSGLWSDCIALRDDPKCGVGQVHCPVYVQLGEFDPVMYGRYAQQEAQCYVGSREVVVEQIDGIGHSFNLHHERVRSWHAICDYLDSRLA